MPAAARVLDIHVCPRSNGPVPHVGGPIVTGSMSVLIGYMPAARVGDKAACVGGVDSVKNGSSTVIICNKPAARQWDKCDHGGVIVTGCFSVQIGDSGGGKSSGFFVAAAGISPLVVTADPNDTDTFLPPEDGADVKRDMEMSIDVYEFGKSKEQDNALIEKYRALGWEIVPEPVDNPSGLQAVTFINKSENRMVTAFRGSEQAKDWKQNLLQAFGKSNQHPEAVAYARDMQQYAEINDISSYSVTGHSLGGGLAATVATVCNVPANTFNPAGVSNATLAKFALSRADANSIAAEKVRNYAIDGEILSRINNFIGTPDYLGPVYYMEGSGNFLTNHKMEHVKTAIEKFYS